MHEIALVSSAPDALDRLESSPTVVAIVERAPSRAVGVTVEGIPVEVVVAPPARYGTELVRATGSPGYVASLGELPDAPSEEELYARLGLPWCPPELREAPLHRDPPALVELAAIRGDLHCHTTWSDGKASVEEMAVAARDRGYEYVAICDHTPNVRVVPGLDADALRRQAEEIAEMNERLAPFRVLRGTECDIRSDGTLDLPDEALAALDWVQLSLHAGQRQEAEELTRKVVEAMRHPAVRCLSHPKGRIINHRPPNALQLERVIEVALEEGVALETNGLPDRLDLRDEEVRLAVEAGVPIVCSTDAHSVRGLGNMQLAVMTARRGWATRGRRAEHARPRRGARATLLAVKILATKRLPGEAWDELGDVEIGAIDVRRDDVDVADRRRRHRRRLGARPAAVAAPRRQLRRRLRQRRRRSMPRARRSGDEHAGRARRRDRRSHDRVDARGAAARGRGRRTRAVGSLGHVVVGEPVPRA